MAEDISSTAGCIYSFDSRLFGVMTTNTASQVLGC